MHKPRFHIFVCNSFHHAHDPHGTCKRRLVLDVLQQLEAAILEREIDAMISCTGCLQCCEEGPVMVVYPHGWWYGDMSMDKVDPILDALEQGREVPEYLIP